MDDLKVVFASNLIALRTNAHMTQAELAEKISYSDKSVSKWERAESLPDLYVVKALSEIFAVSTDYLLSPHDQWEPPVDPEERHFIVSTQVITNICILGIFTIALFVFIVTWMIGHPIFMSFIYAIPVSLITWLVLHSIWEKGRLNYYIVGALILSLFICLYLTLLVFYQSNNWQLWFILIPVEIIVYLSSRIRKPSKK